MGSIAEILDGIFQPRRGGFSVELAEYMLSLNFSLKQQNRYKRLSTKAGLGKLSDFEKAELDEMLAANAVLSILQSKARISLQKRKTAA